THSGHLEVAGASGETVRVDLAGTAAPAGPPVSISPSSYDFGTVDVGATATHRFTVRNETAQSRRLNGLGTAQPFAVSGNSCLGDLLAPGAECWIDVTFAPGASGLRTEVLSVSVDAFGPVTVSLSGTGQAVATSPVLVVSPTSIDFGTVPVGTSSHPLTVTVTNTGTAPSSSPFVPAIGSFYVTHNCLYLAAGSSCELTVTFAPTWAGPHFGSIFVEDLGSGAASVSIQASGMGADADPILALSPSFYDFGEV